MRSRFVCVCCALLLASVVGCGVRRVPVSGTITYKGKPVGNVSVTFAGKEGEMGQGSTDAAGSFSQLASTDGSGLKPGNYTVTLLHMYDGEAYGEKLPPPPPFPSKYLAGETSDLKVSISQDGENKFNFELKD